MNMKEFCRQYAVTKDVIKAFLHAGLLKGFEDDLERDCLCCFAVQRLETCLCLHALGFDFMYTIQKLQCFMERYVKQKAKDTGRKQNEKSIV